MSAKTLSVIYKEKIAEIPDAIDDAKEVANYHKEALKYAVEEMKGNVKGKAKGKSKKPWKFTKRVLKWRNKKPITIA